MRRKLILFGKLVPSANRSGCFCSRVSFPKGVIILVDIVILIVLITKMVSGSTVNSESGAGNVHAGNNDLQHNSPMRKRLRRS
jgi:hypothetical protein